MNVTDYYANAVRQSLVDVGIFPTYDFDLDPGMEVYERNIRAALVELIQELDRTDLVAVYRAAQFLAQSPRSFALPGPPVAVLDCNESSKRHNKTGHTRVYGALITGMLWF